MTHLFVMTFSIVTNGRFMMICMTMVHHVQPHGFKIRPFKFHESVFILTDDISKPVGGGDAGGGAGTGETGDS